MADYLNRDVAISVADYAEDEHPYKVAGVAETYSDYNQGWSDACFYIRNKLEVTTAADVQEVRHGRWIPIEYDGYADECPIWDLWECSECGEEHSGDYDTLTAYCPNCGAKMDGGADNEV